MFRPTMNTTSNSMVQTLASLLHRVQIFGPEADVLDLPPSPDDSILLPPEARYDESIKTVKSASAKPIPCSDNKFNIGCHFYDGSLGSLDYANSLDDTDFETPSFTDSVCSSLDLCEFDSEENFTVEKPGRKRNKSRRENGKGLPEISLSEVALHDSYNDCWMVLYDKVYNVTSFLFEHPGGEELMMEHAGRDGTLAFRSVGHSKAALATLQDYIIGELPDSEKIFNAWENN